MKLLFLDLVDFGNQKACWVCYLSKYLKDPYIGKSTVILICFPSFKTLIYYKGQYLALALSFIDGLDTL